MATDPRDALNRLIAALEHHHDVAKVGSRPGSAALEEAESVLQDAFFTYDDVLFTTCGVELPFDILEDDEELEDEELDEEDLDDVEPFAFDDGGLDVIADGQEDPDEE